MNVLPKPLQELIEAFSLLPGVGQKTAERYSYYLLKQSGSSIDKLNKSLSGIKDNLKFCPVTFAIISEMTQGVMILKIQLFFHAICSELHKILLQLVNL